MAAVRPTFCGNQVCCEETTLNCSSAAFTVLVRMPIPHSYPPQSCLSSPTSTDSSFPIAWITAPFYRGRFVLEYTQENGKSDRERDRWKTDFNIVSFQPRSDAPMTSPTPLTLAQGAALQEARPRPAARDTDATVIAWTCTRPAAPVTISRARRRIQCSIAGTTAQNILSAG